MMSLEILPTVNACLNALIGTLIVTGFILIRKKKVFVYRVCMTGAVITSGLFLIFYIVYHYHHGATRFTGSGWVRPFYFSVLGSHTVLAAITLPFVVAVFIRALKGQFSRHKKMARVTFPMWLYVSITGIVVYLMLYHIYPSR
jgi:uncharacterized membrane protein YozB (DUF420 family)